MSERTMTDISLRIRNVQVPKTTHHSKKIVRVGGFTRTADTPQLVEARDFWRNHLNPAKPITPIKGPVGIELHLVYPHLKGTPKKVLDAGVPIWCPVKPDMSNIMKTAEDILAECGYFLNDSQVCVSYMTKQRHTEFGFTLRVWELE